MNSLYKQLRIARYITYLLDNRFGFGKFKFGLDPILGLIPGFGDVFISGFAFYLVWLAIQLNVPAHVVRQMIRNIIIDMILGFVPFFGDIIDFAYKASSKNMKLLEQYVPNEYLNIEEGHPIEH